MRDAIEIVTLVAEASEVKSLPKGAVVGDNCGGRTFNDNVAAALERRSCTGWKDVEKSGQNWTLILLDQ